MGTLPDDYDTLDEISKRLAEKANEQFAPGRCFVVYQTGPWEGPGSWLYRGRCVPHDWTDYATNREDIMEAGSEHKEDWDGFELEEF